LKNFLYQIIKVVFKVALHLYYGKIVVKGLENVPKDKPVLFLPNHQNALIDPLLIVIDCNRKPYFLTRSDVFTTNFYKSIFAFFQMIPIYRIRDGRDALKNNQAVFDSCAALLSNNEAILMFPEANHNQKRRVRPLSKGFTRILFHTLNQNSELDIQIVPVGLNYKNLTAFPDKAAIYFGKPISVKSKYDPLDIRDSVSLIKDLVSQQLKKLTTHIEDEAEYDRIEKQLDALGVDYLNPSEVNKTIARLKSDSVENVKASSSLLRWVLQPIFWLLNFPVLILWTVFVKPKIWEPEFSATLRFGFSILIYPIYYSILFTILMLLSTPLVATLSFSGLILFNFGYTRCFRR